MLILPNPASFVNMVDRYPPIFLDRCLDDRLIGLVLVQQITFSVPKCIIVRLPPGRCCAGGEQEAFLNVEGRT
jgi:hypothetical protein